MIVKCISTLSSLDIPNALQHSWLTLHKNYNLVDIRLLNSGREYWYIIDDSGEVSPYQKHCFMDLMVWRQQQIEKVLE